MRLEEALTGINPVDQTIGAAVLEEFHNMAIPLDCLGQLQQAVIDICNASHCKTPEIQKRALLVFCADNGVVEEGISQVGSYVTTAVAKSLTEHATVMCTMAQCAKIEVIPVDIGMKEPLEKGSGIIEKSIAKGTNNFAKEPAMTREDAIKAIEVGIELAIEFAEKGYQLLAVGEMGIGNTTTSSAIASVLLDQPAVRMTGAGAGLSAEGIRHKVEVIETAIEKYQLDKEDVLEVLATLGGYDIAGMMGVMIGCAYCKIPCVIDGFISSVSALSAIRLCPEISGYLIASHCSAEPAGAMLIEAIEKQPMITAQMRLGEGSGAVAILPLIDMALKVYGEAITFEEMKIEAYQPL